jgi:thiamine-phosphate pyrophosphorylase
MRSISKFSPDLYVIVDHDLAASSANIEKLTEDILDAGAGAIQYRAKRLSKAQYYEKAWVLLQIARKRNVPFFVNDHLDVALAISADGVHIGQHDLPFEAARKLLPADMILGVSTHSEAQAVDAAGTAPGYIAIGPIFPTSTKANPDPVVGTHTVRGIKRLIGSIPLIAIGGITLGNAAEVIHSGADGIAVASAVVRAADPPAVVRAFKEIVFLAKIKHD